MNIVLDIDQFTTSRPTVVTVGTFDGLHLGHQFIFDELCAIATANQYRTVLLTFSPHPAEVLKTKEVRLISSLNEKIEVFRSMKIDYMVVLRFDQQTAGLTYTEFTDQILIGKLKMKHLVFGYDHTFGKGRQGTFSNLQRLAEERTFAVSQVRPFQVNGVTVSSTVIRHQIATGEIDAANRYLGHPFSLFGKVVEGDKRGRELGYRTANIETFSTQKLIPGVGVYLVQIRMNGDVFHGMCNVGFNPTFDGQERRIEVHIFDFDADIYEDEIGLYFLAKIRDEQKFESKEALAAQLAQDEKTCRAMIENARISGGHR